MIQKPHLRSLYIAIAIYVVVSPLSTYNTFAMFGLVEAKLPLLQLAMTAVMICFAIVASRPLSKHMRENPNVEYPKIWTIGFWVIGPPALFAYYHLRLRPKMIAA